MQNQRKLEGAGSVVFLAIMTLIVMTVNRDIRTAQSASRPDLTGTWILKSGPQRHGEASSGAPVDSEGEGGRRRPPGGGGMGPPGGGMGGRGGGVGGRGGDRSEMPNREEMERMRAAMDAALHTPTRLIIRTVRHGPHRDGRGRPEHVEFRSTGRRETGAANGVPFETTAKWERDGRLRVERKIRRRAQGYRALCTIVGSSAPPYHVEDQGGPGAPGGGTTVTRVDQRRGPLSVGFDQ